ncbi:hypothetical protein GUITHDRAFT_43144, partial [Guillardia theta CCMP2712]
IDRSRIVESSIGALIGQSEESCRSRHFEVNFLGEEGTGTGPQREYFAVASKKFVCEDYGLFGLSSGTRVYHPLAGDFGMFAFGRLLGLAIRHQSLVDVKFSRAFLRMIVGGKLELEMLEEIEPDLYRNLCALKGHQDHEAMDLDFTILTDYQPSKQKVELMENGENIKVDSTNIEKYVELYILYKLRDGAKKLMDRLLHGFFEVVPKPAIRIFSDQELDLLLCGLPKIDVDDWRRCQGEQLCETSQLSLWFWEFVCSKEEAERALLLKFCTGSSVSPSVGFENLPGLSSICRFTLACTQEAGDDRLPTASTCFNLLKIPDYSSKEILEERFHVALHYGSEGFSF